MNTGSKLLVRAALTIGVGLAWGCSGNKSGGEDIAPANVTLTVKRGTSEGTPTLVETKVVSIQERVDAVDYDARSIVLVGPDGKQEVFTVAPDVVNFDQIHKGDMVNARFTQKLAVAVQKSSDANYAAVVGDIRLPALGSKPGIVASRAGEITASVTAIDYATRVVSVVDPHGDIVTFKVAPQAEGLENVHVGDQVVAKFSEAVVITVTGS
jgi:hypothetical protein